MRRPTLVVSLVVRAKVDLELAAAAITAGDALTADGADWAIAPGTRILLFFIEATLVAADDPV